MPKDVIYIEFLCSKDIGRTEKFSYFQLSVDVDAFDSSLTGCSGGNLV